MDRRELVEQLYNEYESLMFHVAYEILHDHHLTEDTVHECVIRLMKAKVLDIDGLRTPPTRKLVQIVARHQAYRQYTKYCKNEVCTEDINLLPSNRTDNIDGFTDMREIISTLPPIYRETVILRLHYGYSYKQVGALLGVSPQTARNRMVKLRKLIRMEWYGGLDEKEES